MDNVIPFVSRQIKETINVSEEVESSMRVLAIAKAFDGIGISCDDFWAIRFQEELFVAGYVLHPVSKGNT